MFSVEVKGLEELQRKMRELKRATSEFDGELCQLKFDPDDPADVERAIRDAEDAIDKKAARHQGNDLVQALAKATKEGIRQRILDEARNRRT